MKPLCLVTGANGHLGNNLIRALLAKGYHVRAGVRDLSNDLPFQGLSCERVFLDLQDTSSLQSAMEGVDILFQAAAVFKHWAKNPEQEIVQPNVQGTKNILAAARDAQVKRIVYVSSVAAVGHNGESLDESNWNQDLSNHYYRSKIISEQLAWELAEKWQLNLVTALPSAMVGPYSFRLTDTMNYLDALLNKRIPFNLNFHFNFVDVRDVAEGLIQLAENTQAQGRYILANHHSSDTEEIINTINQVRGEQTRPYKVPPSMPPWVLKGAAYAMEWFAKLTGKPSELIANQVDIFYGVKQEYDITKAKRELKFNPRPPTIALQQAIQYLSLARDISTQQNLIHN